MDDVTATIALNASSKYFWGEPTALINWCEEDYVMDDHIAEFWNATTNIVYIWAGLNGLRLWRRYDLPLTYFIASGGIVMTAIFSFCFHSSLLYSFQKLDEIFENIAMIAVLHSFESYNKLVLIHIVAMLLGILFIPTWFAEIHLLIVVILGMYQLYSLLISIDLQIPKKYIKHYSMTISIFTLIGGVSWVLDRILCKVSSLFDLNNLPFNFPNPQLHAFGWHLFTALALNELFIILSVLHAYYAKSKLNSIDKKVVGGNGGNGGNGGGGGDDERYRKEVTCYSDKLLGIVKSNNNRSIPFKFRKTLFGLVTLDVLIGSQRKKAKLS